MFQHLNWLWTTLKDLTSTCGPLDRDLTSVFYSKKGGPHSKQLICIAIRHTLIVENPYYLKISLTLKTKIHNNLKN